MTYLFSMLNLSWRWFSVKLWPSIIIISCWYDFHVLSLLFMYVFCACFGMFRTITLYQIFILKGLFCNFFSFYQSGRNLYLLKLTIGFIYSWCVSTPHLMMWSENFKLIPGFIRELYLMIASSHIFVFNGPPTWHLHVTIYVVLNSGNQNLLWPFYLYWMTLFGSSARFLQWFMYVYIYLFIFYC